MAGGRVQRRRDRDERAHVHRGARGVVFGGDCAFLQLAFGYVLGRFLVAAFFLPAYFRGKMETAYQFLGQRFGQAMRNTASITFMVTRVLADGVRLFATAIPLALIIRGSELSSRTSPIRRTTWSRSLRSAC